MKRFDFVPEIRLTERQKDSILKQLAKEMRDRDLTLKSYEIRTVVEVEAGE